MTPAINLQDMLKNAQSKMFMIKGYTRKHSLKQLNNVKLPNHFIMK